MAKKITGYVKLQIPAGEATPAPPVGPPSRSSRAQRGRWASKSFKSEAVSLTAHEKVGGRARATPLERRKETMGKTGKKYAAAKARVGSKPYALPEAMALVRDVKYTKFDESVDIAMLLGVDPKHADQMVRGTVVLPHGTGKSKRVAGIASGDKAKAA